MRCIQCGAELRPNARFCNVCGADQTQALAQAASQAEGQPTIIDPQPVAPAPVAQPDRSPATTSDRSWPRLWRRSDTT